MLGKVNVPRGCPGDTESVFCNRAFGGVNQDICQEARGVATRQTLQAVPTATFLLVTSRSVLDKVKTTHPTRERAQPTAGGAHLTQLDVQPTLEVEQAFRRRAKLARDENLSDGGLSCLLDGHLGVGHSRKYNPDVRERTE